MAAGAPDAGSCAFIRASSSSTSWPAVGHAGWLLAGPAADRWSGTRHGRYPGGEEEIACAVLVGVTNATSESLNGLAKLEARLAYQLP